ncbi:hypothetical protein KZZ52_54825 [Dactylosporangium sp. AC04546]|uniref:hypothetical protein n=1 Tax=Dactylosporangium sp. AC04546 TaxID=2862460 RepID=UPI001EDE33CE|nr:hypothetical protein [Dactylosporangium sp. AC04546]WVK82914.1 hypothetical protein KZZ52_54825 [Dactylosporangium sp. AC04546]
MVIDRFALVALPGQAAVFAAACAERAIGVLLWTVALADRPGDVARYVDALELLWRRDVDDPAAYLAERQQLESMHEMTVGDELIGASAYALHSVLVLHSGLGVVADPTPETLEDCSMTARNGAFRLERLVRTQYLLSAEERHQDENISALLRGVSADDLRDDARRVGRERLSLFRSQF